jgi:hypothetical protein
MIQIYIKNGWLKWLYTRIGWYTKKKILFGMDSLDSPPRSIPVNVKTVQMLFNVVWSFLTVWTTVMRFCAELITRHTKTSKPSQTHIHMKDSSMSTIRKKSLLFEVSIIWCKTVITKKIWKFNEKRPVDYKKATNVTQIFPI